MGANFKLLNSDGTLQDFNSGNNWLDISNFQGYDIPILYLEGNTAGMSKETAVTLDYIYGEKSGTCTLKWQGASSLNFFKKNYTIKFDSAFEVVSGWGAQNKYCLKANFVDHSHARNLICAKLWGQIVKSRTTANETLNALPNGGAVDGFPIIISLNGKFHGLYTWNIPKDGWLFGMSGTNNQQAILCADVDSNAVAFKGLADFYDDFELEYSSDDESAWVIESINTLLGAVMDSDGTNITYGITPYIDWDSAIDYFIHTVLTAGYDGVHRNYILFTHDGVKWGFSAYDMDLVFGSTNSGTYFRNADCTPTFISMSEYSKLFELIWTYMRPQLRTRYKEIRENIMSELNVATEFYNFTCEIPKPLFNDDVKLWKTIPSSASNNIEQILNFYRMRIAYVDQWIENTNGETELPEQVETGTDTPAYTNLVLSSIDTDGSIYNGIGYKNGTRLSSSGSESTAATAAVSGFIPFTYGQTIRAVGATGEVSNGGMYVGWYDENFGALGTSYLQVLCTGIYGSYTDRSDGLKEAMINTSQITSANMSDHYAKISSAKYIRISLNPCDGANMIVTLDEEIPE